MTLYNDGILSGGEAVSHPLPERTRQVTNTTTQIERSLNHMYELGVEHGKQLAEREAKIKQLESEISKLSPKFKEAKE